MSGKSLVSVIIIFLNAEKFIEEAISSVFGQTYDCWELLLVDDGSTDGSTAIARRYAEQYPETVRYLEHPGHQNRGMSATRNLGIRNARGQYIALLDSDDIWLPNKLERQVCILDSHPQAGMVYGRSEYWYSWMGDSGQVGQDYIAELAGEPGRLHMPPELIKLSYPLGIGSTPCPSDLMFRREQVEQIGGFEESFTGKYQMYEDQAFLAKVYLNMPVFVAKECWDRYRQHPDSCVAVVTKAGQYHEVRSYFLNWLSGYLARQRIGDSEVSRALNKALWPYRHPVLHRLRRVGRHPIRPVKRTSKRFAKRVLPAPVRRRLRSLKGAAPTVDVGRVQFGSLARVEPISRHFGFDRGQPIDRYYIESFLATHAADIRGRVLEIGDDAYTRAFGNGKVTTSDVLHVVEGNTQATFVGDLTRADSIPSDAFDCVIVTQTLNLIYDVRAAIKTLYRILKPGGAALITVPGITPIGHDEWTEELFWNFTTFSARRLFEEVFPAGHVRTEAFGNVLAATAFLYGLAVQELHEKALEHHDPGYQLLVTIRATKPEATA